ncbi:MAG: 6-bladed beta-propeller [Gemmatimonadaceae bacterium]
MAQQVRDSAGVRIASYARNAEPLERWTLEPRALLEIGRDAEEGPQAFVDIMGVVRLSDGRIAVANMRPSEIRVFDANGRFLNSLGRNGAGPGEFGTALFRLLRSRDTLIGVDNSLRAQVFDPTGKLVRSLSRARPPNAQRNPVRLGFDRNGHAIVQALELPAAGAAPEAPIYMSLWRESPDTTRHDHILRLFAYRPISRRGTAPPFEVYGERGVVSTDGARICVGVSSRYTVDCYDGRGRLALSLRREVGARSITEDDRRFFRDAYLAANKGAKPEAIASIEESNRLTQFAQQAPVLSRVLLATSGQLWVSEFDRTENAIGPTVYRRPQRPLRWSVFDPDGRWRADIETPARFMVYEVGPDYVLGVTLGSDDVEHVTLYRIRR